MTRQPEEATFVDRSSWPPEDARWASEPDRVAWTDEATHLPCIARRGTQGAWCGYVAVAPGHPLHGVEYGNCPHAMYELKIKLGDTTEWVTKSCNEDDAWCDHRPDAVLNVHGGLTYSGGCTEDKETGVCHVPEEGELDDVWWFGFDCAHLTDYAPAFEARMRELCHDHPELQHPEGDALEAMRTYKTLDYVKEEITRLAAQLSHMK